ncbi:hypothetical protein A2U01_0091186, partial [Trifolium medium]|nr:hypothetical protein [Trifolium medium]
MEVVEELVAQHLECLLQQWLFQGLEAVEGLLGRFQECGLQTLVLRLQDRFE